MNMHDYWLDGKGERAGTGILLIHGLTGTPKEMKILAHGLNNAGFTVYALQLAGHCGTVDDLIDSSWEEWLESVRVAADKMAQHVTTILVGGLSMGAILALGLAEQRSEQIAGVIALSATFNHDGWSMPIYTKLAFILPLIRKLGFGRNQLFFEQPPYGIKDEVIRRHIVSKMQAGNSPEAGLPGNPFWSVVELQKLSAYVFKNLGYVQAPCLVIHAKHDDIASTKNALKIVHGVSDAPVKLILLEDSFHMITIDRERRKVIDECINFSVNIHTSNQVHQNSTFCYTY